MTWIYNKNLREGSETINPILEPLVSWSYVLLKPNEQGSL